MAADRVLIIGWDSAPPGLVFDQFLEAMPNLRRITQAGLYGPLRSTDPPITVPAWASMLSSRNPGQLGFFGLRNRTPGDVSGHWPATAAAVNEPRIWDIASGLGRRVCVINVPQTYPVTPVNGVMIGCFFAPGNESPYVYPASLHPQVESVADGYIIDYRDFRSDAPADVLEQVYAMTDKRFRVAKWLLSRERWDLFMMVEMGSDRIQHAFWRAMEPDAQGGHADSPYRDADSPYRDADSPYRDAIREYYIHLDDQLGELVAAFGEGSVIVVSDHGAKGMAGTFAINDWLIREGYLRLNRPVTARMALDESMIDWKRTRAWAWGGYCARIFVNLHGREPEGTVAPSAYEALREELARRISHIPDDRGRRMANACYRPQELYTGPYVHTAPDLIAYLGDLAWRPVQEVGHGSLYGHDMAIGADDAMHDLHGIYAIRPAESNGGARLIGTASGLAGAHVMDIAPTALRLMGIEPPAQFEGHSLVG